MPTVAIARRSLLVASGILFWLLGAPQSGLPEDARQCVLQNDALRLSLSLDCDGIRFHGAAGQPKPRLGLWVWADHGLADCAQHAPVHCAEPAMPQFRDRIERHGVCLMGVK
jgi:hypothetical protein